MSCFLVNILQMDTNVHFGQFWFTHIDHYKWIKYFRHFNHDVVFALPTGNIWNWKRTHLDQKKEKEFKCTDVKSAESLSDRSDFFYNDQRCAQSWRTSSFLNIIYTLAVKVSISYKLATLATELCRKEKTVNLNVKRKGIPSKFMSIG